MIRLNVNGKPRDLGVEAHASRFTRRHHRIVSGVGHNLPQEAPEAFADAVLQLL